MGKSDLRRILNIIGNVEQKPLVAEVDSYRTNLTEAEKKEMLIVEKQHVAGFKYNKVIDEVIDYIEDYIFMSSYNSQTKTGKKGWVFTIPSDITRSFDFVNNLTLNVNIIDMPYGEPLNKSLEFGRGDTTVRNNHEIVNGKLNSITIILKGFCVDDELVDYSIRNVLYHELNHAYETWKRQLRYAQTENQGDTFLVASIKANELQKNLTGDKYGKHMENIFHRLWDKSELSAAATSTYSYLKSVGGIRENLPKDIQHTQAWVEYQTLKEAINDLKNYWVPWFWELYGNLYTRKKGTDPQKFKNWFLKRTNIYLKNYFHYMLSAATLYYDETEEQITKKEMMKRIPPFKREY